MGLSKDLRPKTTGQRHRRYEQASLIIHFGRAEKT
jgi:hypothetical protein